MLPEPALVARANDHAVAAAAANGLPAPDVEAGLAATQGENYD